ncbi:hypothetical protein [Promicromonospora iranensis]|uniref:Uncharacterized protein n=1 Tax=Promicromonospora iranensis TaxID=1105144 RepID=A0ABU2CST9_9MICO|nr:hypothetical protein [Promicromonospora iranensis]MDR7384401.1 hypothetical protein [Promicromonospora iranensis]
MTADDNDSALEPMTGHVELVSDGDNIIVTGSPMAVERFLHAYGLLSSAEALGPQVLGRLARLGSVAAGVGSSIAAESGRWLKLTEESAAELAEIGLMETDVPGISYAMLGDPGSIAGWLKVESGLGSLVTNPAVLAGAAGIMAQFAAQQEMRELKAYLASIDRKLDDVRHAQKNAEPGKLIGARIEIERELGVRDVTGQVDETAWSAVQARGHTLTDLIGWALLELDRLAGKLEDISRVGELAKAAESAELEVQELLTVIAECLELQDALDVLRLDRVLEASPEALDGQRLVLRTNRQHLRERIAETTTGFLVRLDAAAGIAESNVVLHRGHSQAVVHSTNRSVEAIDAFHRPLSIESLRQLRELARWRDAVRDPQQLKNAAAEVRPIALKVGAGLAVASVVALAAKQVPKEAE